VFRTTSRQVPVPGTAHSTTAALPQARHWAVLTLRILRCRQYLGFCWSTESAAVPAAVAAARVATRRLCAARRCGRLDLARLTLQLAFGDAKLTSAALTPQCTCGCQRQAGLPLARPRAGCGACMHAAGATKCRKFGCWLRRARLCTAHIRGVSHDHQLGVTCSAHGIRGASAYHPKHGLAPVAPSRLLHWTSDAAAGPSTIAAAARACDRCRFQGGSETCRGSRLVPNSRFAPPAAKGLAPLSPRCRGVQSLILCSCSLTASAGVAQHAEQLLRGFASSSAPCPI